MTDLLRRIGSGLRLDGAVRALRHGRDRMTRLRPTRRGRRTLQCVSTRRYDLLLLDGPFRRSSRGVLLVLTRA
jgi:hypothetical protein